MTGDHTEQEDSPQASTPASTPSSPTTTVDGAYEESRRVSAQTITHYDRSARDFWEGTKDHDVSQNTDALLDTIDGDPPFSILDLGCGPGRDLHFFHSLGHQVVGLEGSRKLAEMARAHSGCQVLHQDFMAMDLTEGCFHGVFANASLFHVPSRELPRVLRELAVALKPRGVLLCSNPRGENEEGFSGERYGCWHDLDSWRGYVIAAGFSEILHYYRPPGQPRHAQPWLVTLWRKE